MRARHHSRSCSPDLFSPEFAFPLGALLFLFTGLAATKIFPEFHASLKGALVYLAGLGAYLIGLRLASGIEIRKNLRMSNVLIAFSGGLLTVFFWANHGFLAVLGPLLALILLYLWKNRDRCALPMTAAGLGLYIVSLYLYGIPILNNALRATGFNPLWVISLGLFLLGYALRLEVASLREIAVLTGSGLLFVLGGYRGPVILLILNLMIMLYYRGLLKNRHVFVGIAALILFTMVFGWYRDNLGMGPVTLIAHRLGYTYHRYDQVVNVLSHGWPGAILRYEDPRYKVGELTTGSWRSTNSALFGMVWADGGLVEVIAIFLGVGVVTRLLFSRRNCFFSLWYAYLLLGIEAGIDLNYVIVAPALLSLLYRK